MFPTFPECSQMSRVFYHSVIHGLGFFICFKIWILHAKNSKTRFFHVLYSDKTWIFDQSECALGPIYILIMFKLGLITNSCSGKEPVLLSRERQKSSLFEQNQIYIDNVQHRECAANMK